MTKLLSRLIRLLAFSLLPLGAAAQIPTDSAGCPCTILVVDTSYWTGCGAIIQPSSLQGQAMKLLEPIQLPVHYQVQVVTYHPSAGCAGPIYVCPQRRWCP